jgi:hypothetical protein
VIRQPSAGPGPTHPATPALTDGSGPSWEGGDPILWTGGHGHVCPEVRFERVQILGAAQTVRPFPERLEVVPAVGEEVIKGYLDLSSVGTRRQETQGFPAFRL